MLSNRSPVRLIEVKLLLALLRGEALLPELLRCEPDVLTRLSVKHRIRSILAESISSLSEAPFAWVKWATFNGMTAEQDRKLWARAAKKTIALIVETSVCPTLLKGESLALGNPRDMGDVDLLIPEGQLISTIQLLESNGYAYVGFERNMFIKNCEYRNWDRLLKWSNQFEFREPETGVLIELHTSFFETARVYDEKLTGLRYALNDFTASSILDPVSECRYLCAEDRLILLALHGTLKRSPVRKDFILRHLFDLRNLVSAGIDWCALETRAVKFGLIYYLAAFLRLNDLFSQPCSPPGFIERLESHLVPRQLWLLGRLLACIKDIDVYDRFAIFQYRLVAPFILQGSVRAKIRSILLFPLFMQPTYKLARLYGLPQRSVFAVLLYALEPLRYLIRLIRKIAKML